MNTVEMLKTCSKMVSAHQPMQMPGDYTWTGSFPTRERNRIIQDLFETIVASQTSNDEWGDVAKDFKFSSIRKPSVDKARRLPVASGKMGIEIP